MFFSSCKHEWHQVGSIKQVAGGTVGSFSNYGSVYCPKCGKFKRNICIEEMLRLLDATEVDRKWREGVNHDN